MKNMFENLGMLFFAFLFVAIVVGVFLAPLAIIWALNTLFALGIAYNFWTWLAVVVINITWGGGANFVIKSVKQ